MARSKGYSGTDVIMPVPLFNKRKNPHQNNGRFHLVNGGYYRLPPRRAHGLAKNVVGLTPMQQTSLAKRPWIYLHSSRTNRKD